MAVEMKGSGREIYLEVEVTGLSDELRMGEREKLRMILLTNSLFLEIMLLFNLLLT